MPTHIKIIHAGDFIRATPEGHLNLEESKKLLMELASATSTLSDYEVILDTRKAQLDISVADLWHLANELCNFYKAFSRRLAILCPPERFDRAAFFALCAKNRGLRINVFTSYEDAIEWLIAKWTDG